MTRRSLFALIGAAVALPWVEKIPFIPFRGKKVIPGELPDDQAVAYEVFAALRDLTKHHINVVGRLPDFYLTSECGEGYYVRACNIERRYVNYLTLNGIHGWDYVGAPVTSKLPDKYVIRRTGETRIQLRGEHLCTFAAYQFLSTPSSDGRAAV